MARTGERATVTSTISERVAGTGSYYGRELFKPGRIMGQILAIHTFFYVTFSILLFIMNQVVGVYGEKHLILNQMLSWRTLSQLHTSSGVVALMCFTVSSVGCGSLAFIVLVGRSRRALDFAITTISMHFCCTCIYDGFPKSGTWWTTNILCTAAMTVVCETLSRRQELRDININGSSGNNKSNSNMNGSKGNGGGEGERDIEAQVESSEA